MGSGRVRRSGWRALRAPSAVYAAVCAGLWPVPVVGLLHAESSAVIAGVGFFVAGLLGIGAFRRGEAPRDVARTHLGALAVPWALLTLSLLWRPNCGYGQGLVLFLLLVPPSVLLGLGAAFALADVRAPRTALVLGGLAVAVGGVAADLLVHPQLFTYSHVFGGVLGPIYDDELALRPGLVAAKAQTLLLAAALFAVGWWRRTGRRAWMFVGSGALVLAGLGYVFAVPLGIQQSEAHLRRTLSVRLDAGPVVLHLAPGSVPPERQAALVDEALYRFDRVRARLGIAPDQPIDVYLYPDPDTKAALIGSRVTSVVPVWLPTPQVHMLAEEVPRSLGHELVHVVAREVGAPVLRASPAVGLVEGLAVALEPPDGLPSATDLVVAGRALAGDAGGLDESPARVVERTMSPGGFWTARAGVAYTASGAFTAWLLDEFGAAPVREAYRTGRFEPAFGVPLAALARQWADGLARREPDPEAVAVATWLFRRPSLFEVRCPHHTPPEVALARDGAESLDEGRDARALALFDAALDADSLWLPALDGRLVALARRAEPVPARDVRRLRLRADSLGEAAAFRTLGDARLLSGRSASQAYQTALDSLSPADAVGRFLLRRRAALSPEALRALLAAPPDTVGARAEREAPVLAALAWAQAGRYRRAWRLAQTWDVPADASDRASARLLQAQLAYRAGAVVLAERRASEAARGFRSAGSEALAALADDWAERARWRRGRRDAPVGRLDGPILGAPLDPVDAPRLARRPSL